MRSTKFTYKNPTITNRVVDLPRLWRMANRAVAKLRVLPPGVEPSDALQDACMHILTHMQHGEDRDAYLVTRAWSKMKDAYGKLWRQEFREDPSDIFPLQRPTIQVEGTMLDQDVTLDVQEAIAKLAPLQRTYAVEYWIEGRTQVEIAERHQTTQGNVSQVLARAKARLKEILADGYE